MKKKPSVPTPSQVSPWLVIALLSLAANAGLVIWHVRSAPKPVEAAVATMTPAPSAVPIWTRELAPYAALGSYMAENNRIPDLKWKADQFAAFQEGFRASYEGRGLPLDEAATKLRDEINRRVQTMVEAEQPDPVRDYFRFLREKEGVKETPSGLHYRITEEGAGVSPKAADTVVISYAAGLPDGKSVPALSRSRVKVIVQNLLPGLAEGVQLLKVGGKGLIYVPPKLAFKEADWPPQLPREAPLVFFVELHDIVPAP
jgi:FKBP-type peptidyl-prolyl cis-trans isomerase FkpA/FKBP-type peptidyl-prolyl cis-trans isomerase FklB